jgi:hypothetical protein
VTLPTCGKLVKVYQEMLREQQWRNKLSLAYQLLKLQKIEFINQEERRA